MSAKLKRETASSNKKLEKKTMPDTKKIVPEPSNSLPVDHFRKKTITPQDLLVEYEYLAIHPLDSFYLIEAMNANSQNTVQLILSQKLSPLDFQFPHATNQLCSEDVNAIKEIYASILVEAVGYGHRVGFRPYQLSIWLTIKTKIIIETKEKMKSSPSVSTSDLTSIINRVFLQFSTRQEPGYDSIPLFTLGECKKMIEYLNIGLLMHFNLFKFAVSHPQDLTIYKETRTFDLVSFAFDPMSTAINEIDWPAYCKKQEENYSKLIQEELEKERDRIGREVERLENELAEKETAQIKARLAEAEKAILAPLEPYPIPPPLLPTMDQIFRKKIVVETEIFSAPSTIDIKQQSGLSATVPGSSLKSKKNQIISTNAVANTSIKKKIVRDLLPPPDMSKSKPLERKKKLTTAEPVPVTYEPISTPVITTVEYIDIPLETPLTRQEAADIVSASTISAVEEYKQWVLQVVQWEENQCESRLSLLQKVRNDRDADIKKIKEKQIKVDAATGKGKPRINKV